MSKQFDPGPWHLGQSKSGRLYIYARSGEQPLEPGVCVTKGKITNGRILANAQLMAASPEMYEALKQVLAWFDFWQQEIGPAEEKIMAVAQAAIDSAERGHR